MADTFTSFFNNSQAFGLNVKVPQRTLKQLGETTSDTAKGVFKPILNYLETNENIFNGDVTNELNKMRSANFNTELILQKADEDVNGIRPSFDINF